MTITLPQQSETRTSSGPIWTLLMEHIPNCYIHFKTSMIQQSLFDKTELYQSYNHMLLLSCIFIDMQEKE